MSALLTIDHLLSEQRALAPFLEEEANEVLDVYIDLKSPHAYLAMRPSLEIARDFRVTINFLPYTLSYQALGLSKTVGPDMQRQPPSPAADRKARMYYAAAREYAALQLLPFTSPHRLLDSSLAHRAFLFAKQQSCEIAFALWVYFHGWSTGWRDFELESADDLRSACIHVGIDIAGFDDFVQSAGAGEAAMTEIMYTAENSGCVGVPHYLYTDSVKDRRVGLFGREHLTLIRQKYLAAGFARRDDVVAEFSHAWTGHIE